MKPDTYREHLTDLQVEIEGLRAKLKEAQTGDLISRAAALNALNNILANYVPYLHGLTETIPLDCAVAIKSLPSAQPKMKCIANVTLTDEQVKEAFEEAKCEILAAQPDHIRCRDCKHYENDVMGNPWGVCCHPDWITDNCGNLVDESGWCYRAERRGE